MNLDYTVFCFNLKLGTLQTFWKTLENTISPKHSVDRAQCLKLLAP